MAVPAEKLPAAENHRVSRRLGQQVLVPASMILIPYLMRINRLLREFTGRQRQVTALE
jgi:hypothetical protein